MLQNLPPFVSYIFTATDLPRASLISPLKVKKQPLAIFALEPDAAATVQEVKQLLDFDDGDPVIKVDMEVIPVTEEPEEAELKPGASKIEEEKLSLLDF